jgi:hypothetical protein
VSDQRTNGQLAEALRDLADRLFAQRMIGDPVAAVEAIEILNTAAARLAGRRVVLTGNTALAAARALRSAAELATDHGEPGDGRAWHEIARRVESAIERDGGVEPERPALYCAVHLYAEPGEAPAADTIIGGVAVCMDHAGLVAQGEDWHAIMTAAKRPRMMT